MQSRLIVRKSLLAVNKHVPIDLIVYTRGEYEFLQMNCIWMRGIPPIWGCSQAGNPRWI